MYSEYQTLQKQKREFLFHYNLSYRYVFYIYKIQMLQRVLFKNTRNKSPFVSHRNN